MNIIHNFPLEYSNNIFELNVVVSESSETPANLRSDSPTFLSLSDHPTSALQPPTLDRRNPVGHWTAEVGSWLILKFRCRSLNDRLSDESFKKIAAKRSILNILEYSRSLHSVGSEPWRRLYVCFFVIKTPLFYPLVQTFVVKGHMSNIIKVIKNDVTVSWRNHVWKLRYNFCFMLITKHKQILSLIWKTTFYNLHKQSHPD